MMRILQDCKHDENFQETLKKCMKAFAISTPYKFVSSAKNGFNADETVCAKPDADLIAEFIKVCQYSFWRMARFLWKTGLIGVCNSSPMKCLLVSCYHVPCEKSFVGCGISLPIVLSHTEKIEKVS